jgi:2-hydroxy-6-oxonona-2,4-dienedioate hydrolase
VTPTGETEPAVRSVWTHLMRTEFRQAWIDAGGIRTRYVQAGDPAAPPLIMLPGTASSWETFCANLEAHSAHFNCLALDMIGSGFTDKPDKDYEIGVYVDHILAFMAAIGVDRASFIGVSLGAWIAARIASSLPQHVDKLVLVAPSGMLVHTQTMARIRGTRTKAVEDPSWANIKAVFEPLIFDEHNRIPDLISVRQAIYMLPEMKHAMDRVLCLQDAEIRSRNILGEDEWRRIMAPTLIVLAPDDSEAFYKTGMRALDLIPKAQSIEMREVKHWPHFEKPDQFNDASLKFLRQNGR